MADRTATNHICDAQDRIADAENLVELIGMAHRHEPDAEGKAISTAVVFIIDALAAAVQSLKTAKEHLAEGAAA